MFSHCLLLKDYIIFFSHCYTNCFIQCIGVFQLGFPTEYLVGVYTMSGTVSEWKLLAVSLYLVVCHNLRRAQLQRFEKITKWTSHSVIFSFAVQELWSLQKSHDFTIFQFLGQIGPYTMISNFDFKFQNEYRDILSMFIFISRKVF